MATESLVSGVVVGSVTTHLVLAGFVLKELREQECPHLVYPNTDATPMCQGG